MINEINKTVVNMFLFFISYDSNKKEINKNDFYQTVFKFKLHT